MYHLLRNHYYSLDGESPTAVVEKIFEGGAEEIDNEYVVETFLAKVIDVGNASWIR